MITDRRRGEAGVIKVIFGWQERKTIVKNMARIDFCHLFLAINTVCETSEGRMLQRDFVRFDSGCCVGMNQGEKNLLISFSKTRGVQTPGSQDKVRISNLLGLPNSPEPDLPLKLKISGRISSYTSCSRQREGNVHDFIFTSMKPLCQVRRRDPPLVAGAAPFRVCPPPGPVVAAPQQH